MAIQTESILNYKFILFLKINGCLVFILIKSFRILERVLSVDSNMIVKTLRHSYKLFLRVFSILTRIEVELLLSLVSNDEVLCQTSGFSVLHASLDVIETRVI